jgi:cytochrome oxidase Cu insertion factor (SCO1/SenC/PrrC family)
MDKKTILVGVLAFGLIGLTALGIWLFQPAGSLRGTTYAASYPPAPAIGLIRSNGNPFQLEELQGNLVLLFFGYTSCRMSARRPWQSSKRRSTGSDLRRLPR